MSTQTKTIVGVIVALIVGVIFGYFLFRPASQAVLGGAGVNARLAENYDPYIRTNGGFYTNLPIDINNISSLATTSVTSLCVYNGSNFTVISFASGSTTAAYATSTTCL